MYYQHDEQPPISAGALKWATLCVSRVVSHWTLVNIEQHCNNVWSRENHAFHHIMCCCVHLSFTHISKSRTIVTVVNLSHANMTFLTWYEARNLILKLLHNVVRHPVFLSPVPNTIVHTCASQLYSSICVYFISRWSYGKVDQYLLLPDRTFRPPPWWWSAAAA